MADTIAVMNGGRIEQLGAPAELYERPRTAFVASFLGESNLLDGHVDGAGSRPARRTARVVARRHERRAPAPSRSACGPRRSASATGARTRSPGTVRETAYIGVATEFVVATAVGRHRPSSTRTARPAGSCPRRGAKSRSRWAPNRRSSSTEEKETAHDRAHDPRELVQRAAAGVTLLSPAGLPRRLRRRRRRRRQRRRGQRRAPLLELAALHRLRREDEEAPDARPVHGEDRASRSTTSRTSTTTPSTSARSSARCRRASRSTATSSSSPTTRASPG